MTSFESHVAASFRQRGLRPPDGRLLVAVSGGVDSSVLLCVLARLRQELALELTVAHAHHQLRGVDADADAARVAAAARGAGLPLVTRRLHVNDARNRPRESVEMTARRLRHAFLAETARAAGIGSIALAHHADDQAELVLLRLLRGAGGAGLGGMAWRNPSPADPRVTLIRPLLDQPKGALRAGAAAYGLDCGEDATNQDTRIPRNRIRHELLPLLERDFNPAIRTLLRRTAEIVGAEADCVAAEAARWLASEPRADFAGLPLAVQRAVLRQQLWALGHEPDFAQVERLRESGNPFTPDAASVLRRDSRGQVTRHLIARAPRFENAARKLVLRRDGARLQFAGVTLRYRFRAGLPPGDRHPTGGECFDARAVGRRVILRHWQPGDRFQPLGLPAPAKLQDLFVNRKVPAARRRQLLVAATAAGELFWVESLPPGERFKLRPGTRRALLWHWRRAV